MRPVQDVAARVHVRPRREPDRGRGEVRPGRYVAPRICQPRAQMAHAPIAGQHLLWTEQSSPENLDSITWPRAAASAGTPPLRAVPPCAGADVLCTCFAELFWSGPALTNVSSALPRLHDVSYRMRKRGVAAIALQPLWCALRPHACDLTA